MVEGGRVRVTGALALERLSGLALAALILGPQQAARANAVWPDARFGPALADTPLLSVDVTASQFDFADRVAGRDARLKISMAPGVLQLADFRAKLGEAEITGRLAMRRDGATAALSGAVAVTDLRIDQRARWLDASRAISNSHRRGRTWRRWSRAWRGPARRASGES